MLRRALLISMLLHFLVFSSDRPASLRPLAKPGATPVALSGSLNLPAVSQSARQEATAGADSAPPRLSGKAARRRVEDSKFAPNSGLTADMAYAQRKNGPVEPVVPEPVAAADRAPGDDGVTAEDERLYRLALARAARPFLHQPDPGRIPAEVGSVIVAVASSIGPAPVVSLARSSGQQVLDDRAVDMMARAVATASLPPTMRGRSFRILVPLEYHPGD